jgi:molecular chaperone GrpE
MPSDMGDGDLVEPDAPDVAASVADADMGDAGAGSPIDVVDDGAGSPIDLVDDEELPERDSEIDDITDSIRRVDATQADGSGRAEAPVAAAEVDIAEVDVAGLMAERDEMRHLAQRVQAEFDNYRRRSTAQAQAEAERAAGRLAEALLPVLDAAEAAYLRHPDEVGPLLNQMLTELKKHGLETLDLDGQPFDPEVAEAVAHEAGDTGEQGPIVTEVLRSGYRWKGRTLRPAMVRTKD